jgi:hypothetical protein
MGSDPGNPLAKATPRGPENTPAGSGTGGTRLIGIPRRARLCSITAESSSERQSSNFKTNDWSASALRKVTSI